MLSKRQAKILSAIIKEYTQTANAVSSGILVGKYKLDYSPATVRNEMMALEELGYLVKPHISAGRIPSDKGYRFFVDNLMEERELSRDYQKKLEVELLKLKSQNARLARTTAKLLSGMSDCLALSGIIDHEEYFDFGMHELLEDPEFDTLGDVAKISAALDLIDENIEGILSRVKGDSTEILIGKENPIRGIQNCSMIVAPYRLESGEKAVIAIIGPKRMKYSRNKGLVDFVKKILGQGGLLVLFVSILENI